MNNIRLYMHVATVTLINLIHFQTCIAKKGGAHAPHCTPPGYGPGCIIIIWLSILLLCGGTLSLCGGPLYHGASLCGGGA